MDKPVKPDCYDFAMDFLGPPERPIVDDYVSELEQYIDWLEAQLKEKSCK